MTRAGWIVAALVVAAAVWAVNAPTLEYGFAYDDQAVVLERPPAWQQGWSAFLTSRGWGLGRHATLLSLDLDRRDPLTPRPFRITNSVLAAANAILVLALGGALGLRIAAATTGALLFAVHPSHVDAIVSIVGRAELLAALGVLGSLLLHARGYGGSPPGVLLAGLLFAVAMASKESAACLIVLVVLLELFRPGREYDACASRRPRAWPLAYVVALAAWLALVARNSSTLAPIVYADNPLAHVAAIERVARAGEILWRYTAITIWPFGLKPDLGYAEVTTTIFGGLLAWIAWAGVVAVALAVRRRSPRLGFLLLWLPAAFAITGNVIMPIGTMMAERLVYLPSVGPCLLAGALLVEAPSDATAYRWIKGLLVTIALFALAASYDLRARVWTDDDHYHEQAVASSPRSAKAQYNLGMSLARRGRYEEAEAAFGRALAIVPVFPAAVGYRAECLRRLGRIDEAAGVYEAYVHATPNDPDGLRRLADFQASIGRYDAALANMRRAVEMAPDRSDLRSALVDVEARARVATPNNEAARP